MQEFLLAHWQTLLGSLIIIITAIVVFIRFNKKSVEEQIEQVKEWLLYAVMAAEKELGSGTGAIKLRFVYDMFVTKFPLLVALIPFTTFSQFVDEALDKFKELLATSPELQLYVNQQEQLNEMKEEVAAVLEKKEEA